MYKGVILLIISLLNLFLGFLIISKNFKNKVNIYYFLMLFGVFLWSLAQSFIQFFNNNTDFLNLVVFRMIYLAAFSIPLFFLLFSFYFPLLMINNKKILFLKKLFIIISIGVIILVIGGWLRPEVFYLDNGILKQESADPDFIVFLIYYLIYFGFSLGLLFYKFRKSSGILKHQIKIVLIAGGLSILFCFVSSILAPFFDNFKYDWTGPIFTMFNLFIIGFVILKSQLTKIINA